MKKLYSFLDSKTGVLTPPTVMMSDAEAVRSLYQLAINGNQQIPLLQFSDDFTLFHVADWDDEKGIIPIMHWNNVGNVGAILADFRLKAKQALDSAKNSDKDTSKESDNESASV